MWLGDRHDSMMYSQETQDLPLASFVLCYDIDMKIQTFNQWRGQSLDFCLLVLLTHSDYYEWGFDVFLFGFGLAIRFNKGRML